MLAIIILLIILLFGLYYLNNSFIEGMHNRKHNRVNSCPDMLIQDGLKIYLYNSKLAKVPGVNPIEFNNLEEYVDFTKWQRNQKLRCPVLYLQHTFNTQGESTYKIRPSIHDMQGGLPPSKEMPSKEKYNHQDKGQSLSQIQEQARKQSSQSQSNTTPIPLPNINPNYLKTKYFSHLVDATHDDLPYNTNSVPSYDSSSYYIDKRTPLDIMDEKEQHLLHSSNPMDDNWGGIDYTQNLVDSGYYAGNEVSKVSIRI